MIGIYKITNLINGKCYIGQSVNIQKRFISHKSIAFNPKAKSYNYPLYRAIRKYGWENFYFEILEECKLEELNEREKYYISKYQAHGPKGYNLDDGGTGAIHYLKLSEEKVSEIINRLKTSLDNSDIIGDEFGVSGRVIRAINSGESCYRETETYPIRPALYTIKEDDENSSYKIKEKNNYCEMCGKEIHRQAKYCVSCAHIIQRRVINRPEPLEIGAMVKEYGFAEYGRQLGIDGNIIKKWCKSYEIPYLKDELISWYNLQMGIEEQSLKKKEKIEQRKMVKQIDIKTGETIAIYESTNAAARALNKKKGTHISEVCNGKLNVAYGYKWEYIQ